MKKATLFALSAVALLCGTVPAQGKKEAAKPSLLSQFPVKFYGYVKLDAAWDDSRISPGNFAKWVMPESNATTEDDSEMNITANQTRFGFDICGPKLDNIETGAKIEMDFYGGGAENKSVPRMRHAFLWAYFKESGIKLVAGQTWDLLGLKNFCPTLNLHPGWWVGNIGFRRPQISIHKEWKHDNMRIVGGFGIFRTIGDAGAGFSPGDTGEDSNMPTIQGRLGVYLPLVPNVGDAMFALSGHFGSEEYDIAADDDNEELSSWSLCLDFSVPVHKKVKINGCFFMGENLDDFLGGIGQGVNAATTPASPEEIASQGGFINICMHDLVKDWEFNLGFGMDDPDNDDMLKDHTTPFRDLNTNIYGNAKYNITKNLKAGLEIGWWQTEYYTTADTDGDALRVQLAFIYKF